MTQSKIPIKKNFREISDKVDKPYANFIVGAINDHCLRLAVMTGEYRWHYHENTDELFMVLEGQLKIEFKENDALYLNPGDFVTIPSRTIHKTSATSRTVNLTIEKTSQDTVFVE
jgi:mannose-6-phosphate isomerase-like protein (cupin superfamily)